MHFIMQGSDHAVAYLLQTTLGIQIMSYNAYARTSEEQVLNQHLQCKGRSKLWYTAHRLHEMNSQDLTSWEGLCDAHMLLQHLTCLLSADLYCWLTLQTQPNAQLC